MAILAGVGSSKGKDARSAGQDALQQALTAAHVDVPDIVFVFSSVSFSQNDVLSGIREVSGGAMVVGCSTAGEITSYGPDKGSVAVMVVKSDVITFNPALVSGLKADSRKAGVAVAETIKQESGDALKLFMMIIDGLSGNGSEVIRGITSVLGSNFPVVGGGAGDDALYKKTYQYFNDKVVSDSVVGVGFSGNFKYAVGVRHGWIPVSPPMKVTKSEGSVLHEVNNAPAIKIYEDYFGTEEAGKIKEKVLAELALSYPLGLKVEGSDELLLRAPFFVNKEGSITCGGEIPENAEVRLMVGSTEEAIVAAQKAAAHAMEQLNGTPKVVFVFNCHVRDKLLGEKGKEEIGAIREIIGTDVPMIGLYTYSEQAPLMGEVHNIEQCKSEFHNETIVILIVGE